MANEILEKARHALNRSQQFRIPQLSLEKSKSEIITQNNNREIDGDGNLILKFAKAPATRQARTVAEFKEIPKRPILVKSSTIAPVSDEGSLSTSSLSITLTTTEPTSKSKGRRNKTERKPSREKPSSIAVTQIPRKIFSDLEMGVVNPDLSPPTSSIGSSSSKRQTYPRVIVKSLIESKSNGESKSRRRHSKEISHKVQDSLAEISEHLEEGSSLESEIKTTKSKTEVLEVPVEDPTEDTLSHVSSLRTPRSQDEVEEVSSQISSKSGKSTSSTSASSSNQINAHSVSQLDIPSASNDEQKSSGDDLSQRLQSIMQDITSIRESIHTKTYSSAFIPEDSSVKSKPKISEAQELQSTMYGSSSFLTEDEVEAIPSEASTSKKAGSVAKSESYITPVSPEGVQSKSKPKKYKTVVEPKPILISKKDQKEKTKANVHMHEPRNDRHFRPRHIKFEQVYHDFEKKHKPKLRSKNLPDFSHQINLNHVGDLPAFCVDLIRNVVDSNERMYNYTMEAAENMTDMYRHNRKKKKRKDDEEQK